MGIGMRIGINGSADINDLERTVAEAARAEAAGFDSFWTAQIFGFDALTAVAVTGQSVPRIELGTAVVPTYPRHPMVMAGQALTVQVAIGGRLALGIGLSHQIVVENMWGYSYAKPVRHMREYLDALIPLLRGEGSDVRTDDLTSVGSIDLHGATPPPVLVAALGPQLLKVAGSRGCGTDHVVHRRADARRPHHSEHHGGRRAGGSTGAPDRGVIADLGHDRHRGHAQDGRGRVRDLRRAAVLPGHARPRGRRRPRRRGHHRATRSTWRRRCDVWPTPGSRISPRWSRPHRPRTATAPGICSLTCTADRRTGGGLGPAVDSLRGHGPGRHRHVEPARSAECVDRPDAPRVPDRARVGGSRRPRSCDRGHRCGTGVLCRGRRRRHSRSAWSIGCIRPGRWWTRRSRSRRARLVGLAALTDRDPPAGLDRPAP